MCCLSTAFEERSIRKGKAAEKRQKQRSRILQSLHLKRTLSAASADNETEEQKSRLPVNFFRGRDDDR